MFGQIVIGPPGSGKTTYCEAIEKFLTHLGRKVAVINLDPANDILPYKCTVNIAELVTLEDVMDELKLGPNGGLLYCMEYLEKNIDWLKAKLDALKDHYILFDCPGQVELYTHHNSIREIFGQLVKWDYRLVSVHLVDSHYCSDPSKFISVLFTSLATMLQVELPHINVLSKADLIEKYGKLAYNLDFYTDVLDLSFLTDQLKNDPFFAKFAKMNDALVGVIEDYSLVSFTALDIQDKESLLRIVRNADKANGYVFGDTEERTLGNLMSYAVASEFEYEKIANIREKYMDIEDGENIEDGDDSSEEETAADFVT